MLKFVNNFRSIIKIANNGFTPRNKSILNASYGTCLWSTKFKEIPSKYLQFRKINLSSNCKNVSNTNSALSSTSKKIVGTWLFTCGGMVFVAVVLGGVTRLTESGLSMVTWKFLGEKMPVDELSWLKEFEKYKQFPEYKILNNEITLEDFKRIWWMEYMHRMWGRLIGAVFIFPASYFWMKNMLTPVMKKRVFLLGSLIGAQGLMGWYMVKSGLENKFDGPSDVPRVSQYRLASHLGLAFIIYSGFLYSALDSFSSFQKNIPNCLNSETITQNSLKQLKRFQSLVHFGKGLIFLTVISGAFVAGLDAGLIYNTFPKMANKWIPDDLLVMQPYLKNFTENPTTVQFDHRIMGILTLSTVTGIYLLSRKYKLQGRTSTAAMVLLGFTYLQASIGILTLLNHVPTYLAAIHQSGSLFMLSSVIWLSHEMKFLKKIPK